MLLSDTHCQHKQVIWQVKKYHRLRSMLSK